MRTGQCLATRVEENAGDVTVKSTWTTPHSQWYGVPAKAHRALDAVLIWWLIIGLPLVWAKGKVYKELDEHVWIGVHYKLRTDGIVDMSVPPSFLREILTLLKPLVRGIGSIPLEAALATAGKCGRLAHIVREAHPFSGAMYAAYTDACVADTTDITQAHPHHAACSRFQVAARWLKLLITGDGHEFFRLIQEVSHIPPPWLRCWTQSFK